MTDPRTAVIVGASLAGGRAAETLRAEGFDGRVVLIGSESHRPYERPPLSKGVLDGTADAASAFLRPAEYYADNSIEEWYGTRASLIDVVARTVWTQDDRSVAYDMLLLATGAIPRRLSIPGSDLAGVHTLRTIDDALAIGARLESGARVVVVGAGFIGAEVAASGAGVGCDVVLLEMLDVPLQRVLGAEVGAICGEIHREHGVDLRTGVRIDHFEGDDRVRRVVLGDETTFEADVVVIGVGVDPADELARDAGIACNNGILVNETCETSAPGVFAAGDVANHPNPILGRRIRVEHWQNAQNQGAAAARAMLGSGAPHSEIPWFWSDQHGLNLQMFGHATQWESVALRGDVAGRAFSAWYLDRERVVAAFSINARKDARAGRDLIRSGVRVDAAELSDAGTDLRALAIDSAR